MSGKGTSSMPKANGLKKIPGGPSPEASVGWGSKAKEQEQYGKYMWTTPHDLAAERKLTDFPYIPFAPNDYDTVANIKNEFAGQQNNWVVPLTERDTEWLLQKRDQLEKAEFDAWAGQKFDLTDPAQVALFKQICPEYFERRKEVIETQIEIQKRVALLKLLGINSMDDLRLAWAVETGRITPPAYSVANPVAWRNGVQANANAGVAAFKSGYFSVIKWLPGANAGKTRSANTFAAISDGAAYMPAYYPHAGRPANYFGPQVPYPYAPDILETPAGGVLGGASDADAFAALG